MFRHVGIVVNDLGKMIWFYQDVIGLEILYDKIEEGIVYQNKPNPKKGFNRIISLFDIGNGNGENKYEFNNENNDNNENIIFETQSYCNRKNSDSDFSDMDINVDTKV